jgi:hypothetical protein
VSFKDFDGRYDGELDLQFRGLAKGYFRRKAYPAFADRASRLPERKE